VRRRRRQSGRGTDPRACESASCASGWSPKAGSFPFDGRLMTSGRGRRSGGLVGLVGEEEGGWVAYGEEGMGRLLGKLLWGDRDGGSLREIAPRHATAAKSCDR
jgi:hypothetical protein